MKNELENLRSKIANDNISQADEIFALSYPTIHFEKLNLLIRITVIRGKNFQEWYDEDCKPAKKEVNKYCKLYQEALRNKLSQTETKLRKQHFFKAINSFNSIRREKGENVLKKEKGSFKAN